MVYSLFLYVIQDDCIYITISNFATSQVLGEVDMLPKIDRESLLEAVDTIKKNALNPAKNASIKDDYTQVGARPIPLSILRNLAEMT